MSLDDLPTWGWDSLPTVLLVHGGFTDTSTWTGVLEAMAELETDVIAVANPLRGLASDAEYVAAFASSFEGLVLLVGHGYGGAVISVAGALATNVVGLVYVAGAVLDETERCVDLIAANPDRRFLESLRPVRLRIGDEPLLELFVRREAYAELVAADHSPRAQLVGAASQRPIAAAALDETPQQVAWRDLPCWSVIATDDHVFDVATQRVQAVRANAVVAEVGASHLITASHPEAVARVIRAAAYACAAHASDPKEVS